MGCVVSWDCKQGVCGVMGWQERGAGCKEMTGIAHSMRGWGAECYGMAGVDVG